ncbi:MAG: NAD(P)-dependent oxidoreductase [Candidatus Kapaibacterium sp.]|nr:NAD(P)-dependent oxidoreductase [Ignavibacteriota bacterium]MCB9220242.1 NAD(P)-dependent oxidoreductase [Ignavibacteria bacterium]
MKVLVTGATGFIGSHIADQMKEKGADVICIVRKTSNLRWVENKGYSLVEASLSDIESLKEVVKDVDIIFHSAGLTAANSMEDFVRANLTGTKNLFEAAKYTAPNLQRFLHVSSQTAVGPSVSLDEISTEEQAQNPLTSYGKSKKMAEDYLKASQDILPITIVRPPAVYGPRDTATLPMFQAAQKGIGTLIGFDDKYVSLVSSMDLTRGIVEAALSDNTIGESYFIASEKYYNWTEIIDTMGASAGRDKILKLRIPHLLVKVMGNANGLIGKFTGKPPVFDSEKSIDFIQKYWTCSVEKAKRDFGYAQKYSLKEGFDITFEWYKSNGWIK